MTAAVPPPIVPPAKLTDDLLRPDHPVGGSKAAFFQASGFSLDHPDVITAAFVAHPDHNPIADTERSRWGVKYTVRCRVRTPNGRDPCILTVRIVPPGETGARLVTAYPDDGGSLRRSGLHWRATRAAQKSACSRDAKKWAGPRSRL